MTGDPTRELFSADYAEARMRFIEAASSVGADLQTYAHPLPGPSGETLACDVATLGPDNAQTRFIVSSGTHGVEGFAGAACQVSLLRRIKALPVDVRVILVHAVNPYGFANLRRTNEDNVDINRNFINHVSPPTNDNYTKLHEVMFPPEWIGPPLHESERAWYALLARRGWEAVLSELTKGQSTHPDGIFYAGFKPSWSNGIWRTIIANEENADRIIHLDIHTGLGPSGHGELIYLGSETDVAGNAANEWSGGEARPILDGAAVSPNVDGPISSALPPSTDKRLVVGYALEFGTVAVETVLRAMRIDAWLNSRPETPAEITETLRAEVRAAFEVNDPRWRQQVLDRFHMLFDRIVTAASVSQ
jgi:hypothetical protein